MDHQFALLIRQAAGLSRAGLQVWGTCATLPCRLVSPSGPGPSVEACSFLGRDEDAAVSLMSAVSQ